MNAKLRLWHVVAIVAGVLGGAWLLLPPVPPPAPDFTAQGFTSVRVTMQGHGDVIPEVAASSNDPAVIAGLAEIMRSGQSVPVCRCGWLGSLEFQRPDGTAERVLLMPPHHAESVEFRAGAGRYRVNRKQFLRIVEPLGIPASRWYDWPAVAELGADSPDDALKKELESLGRAWVVESQIVDGKKVDAMPAMTIRFTGDKVVMTMGDMTMKGSVKLDLTKNPKQINFEMQRPDGTKQATVGIYELKGDELKITCAKGGSAVVDVNGKVLRDFSETSNEIR